MTQSLKVRALKAEQTNIPVYSFFLRGTDVLKVAEISRIQRPEQSSLQGFQRKEIVSHVNEIRKYLQEQQIIFPNALILCFSPEVHFSASRGSTPREYDSVAQSGTLTIPIGEDGSSKCAWIVDGQQRSLALKESKSNDLPVPVVAFVSNSLEVMRQQFILVNKAKPLPGRLIDELLPEIGCLELPGSLSPRKLPSELCNLLDQDKGSPFYRKIKFSSVDDECRVVMDSSVRNMISERIQSSTGCLGHLIVRVGEQGDHNEMYRLLVIYWSAVSKVFKTHWGVNSNQSMLMHGAGIAAMGQLMDHLYIRLGKQGFNEKNIQDALIELAPHLHWSGGQSQSGFDWSRIQNTPKGIKELKREIHKIFLAGGLV